MAANQLTLSLGNYPDGLNVIMFCVLNHFSCVWLLRPHGLQPSRLFCLWGFSRQEYWSGLPCPPPGDLPNPGIKPTSPALAGGFLTTSATTKATILKRGRGEELYEKIPCQSDGVGRTVRHCWLWRWMERDPKDNECGQAVETAESKGMHSPPRGPSEEIALQTPLL